MSRTRHLHKPQREKVGAHVCVAELRGEKHAHPYCKLCGRAMKSALVHRQGETMSYDDGGNSNGHAPETNGEAGAVPTPEEQAAASFLLAEFAGVDSVAITLKSQNVSPMQLLALAALLDFQGRRALGIQANQQAQAQAAAAPKIAVPSLMGRPVRA